MPALETLRAEYVPRVRAQLGRLAELLAAADAAQALALAHKIAGAAGSYGLGDLSAEARVVELALEEGGAPTEHLERVAAMLAALPVLVSDDRAPKILVLGDAVGADVIATPDPEVAFEWAMDEPLLAVVVDYALGRALLRSLSSLESMSGVPIVLTGVDDAIAERTRAKTGASATFPGIVNDRVLARARELAS